MIDSYLLKYFVALEKFKTLSDTAKNLNLSQSALSRSMQKLENLVDVQLFTRKKNSIALNDNGKFFAKYAAEILSQIENSIEKVREFDRKSRTISVGSCAPVPLNKIIFLLTNFFPESQINFEMGNDDYLLQGLEENFFNLIILHKKPNDTFFSVEFEREKLFLAVPLNHKFADKDGIYLEELNDENILLYSKIGFWYDLCKEKAPNAKFLLQNDREIFNDLVALSNIPSFTTNVMIEKGYSPKNRINIPVLNVEADTIYYFSCKLNQRSRFQNLLLSLQSYNSLHQDIEYHL